MKALALVLALAAASCGDPADDAARDAYVSELEAEVADARADADAVRVELAAAYSEADACEVAYLSITDHAYESCLDGVRKSCHEGDCPSTCGLVDELDRERDRRRDH